MPVSAPGQLTMAFVRCCAGRFPVIWMKDQGWRRAMREEKATLRKLTTWLSWGTNQREGGWGSLDSMCMVIL